MDAMTRALDFVADNLQRPIQVADMAGKAAYSLYYFCRMFHRIVHHAPYDYLIRRRLSAAATALTASRRKIIDIAYDLQFQNPETFSRAFRRMFALQPSEWRKNPLNPVFYLMPSLTREHLIHRNSPAGNRPEVLHRETWEISGWTVPAESSITDIEKIWHATHSESHTDPVRCVVLWDMPGHPEGMGCLAGWPDFRNDQKTSGWIRKQIPGGTYAVFPYIGSFAGRHLARDYALHTWLPKSGCRLARPMIIERYHTRPVSGPGKDIRMNLEIPLAG